MPRRNPICLGAILMAILLTTTTAFAQSVALADTTSTLSPSADWVTLGEAELRLPDRPSDPQSEAARSWLLGCIDEILTRERADQHVLLHRTGSRADQLQLVNCYADDLTVTSSDLLKDDAIAKMCEGFIEQTSNPDRTLICTGHEVISLFADQQQTALVMHFAQANEEDLRRTDLFVVPAGDQLQYFECQFLADDPDANTQVQALLSSFNGAKETDSSNHSLLLAGLTGATAGILTALLRRRRQMHRASIPGSGAA